MTMADKIAVMNKGKIEQMGAPEELYESPQTAFVANFLGSSNLLHADVRATDGDFVVADVVGQRVRIPKARVHSTNSEVYVGVRPEKIRLVEEGADDSSENRISGVVLDSSYTGIGTEYVVAVTGSDATMKAFVQNHSTARRLAVGSHVDLVWHVEFTFALDGDEDPHAGEGSPVGPETSNVRVSDPSPARAERDARA